MRSKAAILSLLTAALVLAALAMLPAAEAQQAVPGPAVKSPVASPTPPPNEEDDVIKVDTDVVNVLFTAQDKNRRLLTTLKQEDFRLLENGEPQEVTTFSRQVDLPLSLAILIDVSASQDDIARGKSCRHRVSRNGRAPVKGRGLDSHLYRGIDARAGDDK